eukprot:scaffold205447_cov30-Tisochrysis_lutea.AAC.1
MQHWRLALPPINCVICIAHLARSTASSKPSRQSISPKANMVSAPSGMDATALSKLAFGKNSEPSRKCHTLRPVTRIGTRMRGAPCQVTCGNGRRGDGDVRALSTPAWRHFQGVDVNIRQEGQPYSRAMEVRTVALHRSPSWRKRMRIPYDVYRRMRRQARRQCREEHRSAAIIRVLISDKCEVQVSERAASRLDERD